MIKPNVFSDYSQTHYVYMYKYCNITPQIKTESLEMDTVYVFFHNTNKKYHNALSNPHLS